MIKVVAVNAVLIVLVIAGFHYYSVLFEPNTTPSVSRSAGVVHPAPPNPEASLEWPEDTNAIQYKEGDANSDRRDEVLYTYFQDHPILGFRPHQNFKTRVRVFYKDEVVYDVKYHFDEHHRRHTPHNHDPSDPDKDFALFFGGSFVLGDGVGQEQTLPWHYGDQAENVVAYNYGFHGYGIQHMLLQIQHLNLKSQIPQKKGIAFYHYFPFHRTRLVGSTGSLLWTEGNYPYVDYDDQGQLEFKGLFRDVRGDYMDFLEYLNGLAYLKNRFEDIPGPYWPFMANKFCDVIEQSKQQFLKQFPESQFVVVISYTVEKSDPLVEQCLKPRAIEYVDLSGSWGEGEGLFIRKGVEHHYSNEGNQRLAKDILSSLKKQSLLK